jgi:ribosome maturation factor RimP
MFRDKVKELLDDSLQKRKDLFLIDFEILEGNKIRIVIDGDNGVLVEDCMFVSRAIEHNLDRETEDFSLEVSSAGATTPLVHKRQYKKHIGRILKIATLGNEKYEAVLTAANNDFISLEWKAREPKPIGKGKITVKKNISISFEEIEKAQIKLVF